MAETGQFAVLWRGIAEKFKLDVEFLPTDWRRGADVDEIEARLAADRAHKIKAVWSCTTRPRPAASPIRSKSARPSIAPTIRRC